MFKIISPATSANLAPGFDSFGICFNIANEILAEEFQDAIIVNNHGDTLRNKENLIVEYLSPLKTTTPDMLPVSKTYIVSEYPVISYQIILV